MFMPDGGRQRPSRRSPPASDDAFTPLTPEECRRIAASFSDLPPDSRLSAEELEQLQEHLHGKPLRYGTSGEAIAAMQRRLLALATDKAKTIDALETAPADLLPILNTDLADLNSQIAELRRRLDAYRFQQRHEN